MGLYLPVSKASRIAARKAARPACSMFLERLAIDPGCASVPLGCTVSLFEGLDLRNMHEQTPEAM